MGRLEPNLLPAGTTTVTHGPDLVASFGWPIYENGRSVMLRPYSAFNSSRNRTKSSHPSSPSYSSLALAKRVLTTLLACIFHRLSPPSVLGPKFLNTSTTSSTSLTAALNFEG